MSTVTIRPFAPSDEPSWLVCRVLAFLGSAYFDDVRTSRSPIDAGLGLVAVIGDEVVGILDIEFDGDLATIDTVAVLPGAARRGIASALLAEAIERMPPRIRVLDAWTREDDAANAWYRSHGFAESDHYLHVYKSWHEAADGFATPDGCSAPVTAFMHARIDREAELRRRFRRVHVCRRYALTLPASPPG